MLMDYFQLATHIRNRIGRQIEWSPDGMRIASGTSGSGAHDFSNKTVHIWNADGNGQPFMYEGHTDAVLSVAWSPDGTRIASTSQDCTVQVWSAG